MQTRSVLIAVAVAGAGCSLFIDTGGFESDPSGTDAGGADANVAPDAPSANDAGAGDAAPSVDAASDGGTGRDASLIGDWPFDDGMGSIVLDKSGQGHNGIVFGGAWVADRNGADAKALSFDGGASSYVSVAGATEFDRTASPAFTMTIWARIDEQPAHDLFYSINFGAQDSAFGIELLDATTLTYWDDNQHVAPATIPSVVGQWHHLGVVVEGTEARIFFDGVRVSKGTASTTPRTSTQIFFGRSSFNNTMAGVVDSARFFRSALTDAEMLAEKNR